MNTRLASSLRGSLLAVAAVAATAAAAASNAELAYHPALAKQRPAAVGIDASAFIPGHPAGGTAGVATAAEPARAKVGEPAKTLRSAALQPAMTSTLR